MWAAGPRTVTVEAGAVVVELRDRGRAPRSEPVARWLAEDLARILPTGRVWRLQVERRTLPALAGVEGETLLLHPRMPSASRDERLQVLCTAAWLLLRPEIGSEAAWARALELVAPLRPAARGPRWWPRCCAGLDALEPPDRSLDPLAAPVSDDPAVAQDQARGASGTRAYGRADLYGGFRTPLFEDWPWVIGGFGVWAPIERGELVFGLDGLPLGLVELRMGAGWARWKGRILRLDAGPLLAWNPGSALPESQRQEEVEYGSSIQAGVWADAELGGWRSLVRVIPSEQLGVDAWIGWERRFAIAERWSFIPFTRARYLSEGLPERRFSAGGSWGVRWAAQDALLVDRALSTHLELEHVIPTGRMPGPAWLRPRAVLLRAGADGAWAEETGFQAGWTGSVGLAMNPLREIKGIAWLILATPPDFSSLSWFVWFSTWMPRP